MVIIDDLIINSSYYEILSAFRVYLNSRGIYYFRDMKQTQDNIMVTCPFHKDGQERKPSAGISTKDGIFHCFTCGTVRTFTEVLSYCLGYYDDKGAKGKEWIINNLDSSELEQRSIDITLSREKPKISYISEEELDSYRYTHPYMYQRKLTDEIIEKYDVGYDRNFIIEAKDGNGNISRKIIGECITFPVRDIRGRCLFIARRAIHQKLFHYPSGAEKPLYGIYELSDNPKSLIVCESIFNALTCAVYGKEALALNGTGSKQQLEDLSKLGVRTIYIGLDNDEAGNKGAMRIYNKLKNRFMLYRMIFPLGKDINDLTKEEFDIIYYNAVKMG